MKKLILIIKVLLSHSAIAKALFFLIAFFLFLSPAKSQAKLDSLFNKLDPQKWSAAIEKKVSKLEEKMIAKSEKMLRKLQKEEERILQKLLSSKDSLAAKAQLEEIRTRYAALQQKLKNPSSLVSAANVKDYVPWLDSAGTALKFLDQQGVGGNIKDALSKVESFNGRLQQADEIKRFIRERKEQLKQQLENLGLVKELKKFNKEIFYYAQTIREYKEILKDPKKIERKAIEFLSKTKMFQDFLRRNSMLASLFRMPGDPNDPSVAASLAGLQTRASVNNLIQQQLAAGGSGAQAQFSQNIQAAQSQLQQLKDKVNKWGGSSSNDIMPDGFIPNRQRVKSFWKKWEISTGVQSVKANSFFPVTTDLSLMAGFRPRDGYILGLGFGGLVGWGRDIRHIAISYQGLSAKSFVEIKLKGSFHFAAGYEMNYRNEIRSIDQLRDQSAWSNSGLLGISKVVSVRSKLFKKTKIQLLWDFLSYQQVPRGQPIIFRIGYNF